MGGLLLGMVVIMGGDHRRGGWIGDGPAEDGAVMVAILVSFDQPL
jgi:hypothetical protein